MVAERDIFADLEAVGEVFVHIECDRYWPERAISSAHVVDDTVIIGLAQEPFERVEAAVHQEFQVTNLTRCEVVAFQVPRFDFEFLGGIIRNVKLWNRTIGEMFDGPVRQKRF